MDFLELKKRYLGRAATQYDQSRTMHPKWRAESQEILLLLSALQSDDLSILDLPCGTGRIIDLLDGGNIRFGAYVGVDISEDMLAVSRSKVSPDIASKIAITYADALTYRADQSKKPPTLIFCLRFVNWLGENHLKSLLENLKHSGAIRICITNRSIKPAGNILLKIIYQLTARLSYSTWKRKQSLHDTSFFSAALGADWSVDVETNLESRLDATVLSLLVFKKK